MAPTSDRRAVLALLVVQLLFGIQYVAAKEVLAVVAPRHWALIRASSAALLLFAYIALRRVALPRTPRSYLQIGLLAVIGVALNQYLFVEGLKRTTPAHSAVINGSIPVLVLSIAVALGRERATLRRASGIALTLVGVLALIGFERLEWASATVRGDLLTLMNATSYAFFLVLGKPVMERHRTVPATALLFGFGSLWLVPVGLPGIGTVTSSHLPPRILVLGLLIVLGPTIGSYALNTYALRRVDASLVALFVYLQPVVAAALSIALSYERPTLRLLVSTLLVFAGIALAIRGGRPAPPVTPGPTSGRASR